MAYINMFGILGSLPMLCKLDKSASELADLKKPISLCMTVKGGPKATFIFADGGCMVCDGEQKCDIKIPFSSCEKFNGMIDGTVTPIPSKGFTKIGFLLKNFIKLTDILSAYLRATETHQRFIAEMVKRGVYLTNHHNHFINYALSDDDIKETVEIADEVFKIL